MVAPHLAASPLLSLLLLLPDRPILHEINPCHQIETETASEKENESAIASESATETENETGTETEIGTGTRTGELTIDHILPVRELWTTPFLLPLLPVSVPLLLL
jgi:hypothetical protein